MILTVLIGIVFLFLIGSILLIVRTFIQNGTSTFKSTEFYKPVIVLVTIILSSFIYVSVGTKKPYGIDLAYSYL